MILETVKVSDGADGFIVINKVDFKESVHELYVEKPAEETKTTTPPPADPKKSGKR